MVCISANFGQNLIKLDSNERGSSVIYVNIKKRSKIIIFHPVMGPQSSRKRQAFFQLLVNKSIGH